MNGVGGRGSSLVVLKRSLAGQNQTWSTLIKALHLEAGFQSSLTIRTPYHYTLINKNVKTKTKTKKNLRVVTASTICSV